MATKNPADDTDDQGELEDQGEDDSPDDEGGDDPWERLAGLISTTVEAQLAPLRKRMEQWPGAASQTPTKTKPTPKPKPSPTHTPAPPAPPAPTKTSPTRRRTALEVILFGRDREDSD